jgi:hypothetical protein
MQYRVQNWQAGRSASDILVIYHRRCGSMEVGHGFGRRRGPGRCWEPESRPGRTAFLSGPKLCSEIIQMLRVSSFRCEAFSQHTDVLFLCESAPSPPSVIGVLPRLYSFKSRRRRLWLFQVTLDSAAFQTGDTHPSQPSLRYLEYLSISLSHNAMEVVDSRCTACQSVERQPRLSRNPLTALCTTPLFFFPFGIQRNASKADWKPTAPKTPTKYTVH